MENNVKYKVFISYRKTSSVNADFIRKSIIDNSEYSKHEVFLDKHEIGPEMFDCKIRKAICNSNCLVLLITKGCFTPKKDGEDWFLKEISTAIENHKVIIPVLFDGINAIRENLNPSELDGHLGKNDIEVLEKTQSVTYSQEYPQASIEKLVKFIVQANETKNFLEKIILWTKRTLFLLLFFGMFFLLCFGIGFLWGYYSSSTAEENVIVDNTKIVNNDLIFDFAGLQAIYDLDNEKISISEIDNENKETQFKRSEILLGTFTFSSVYKLTERNLTNIKYLKFLKNGSKASKITLFCAGIGVCMGSICGFSQGSYFGRTLRQQEAVLLLYPKLSNRTSWLPVINKNILLKIKYKRNSIIYEKECIVVASPVNENSIIYKMGLTKACILLQYNDWNILENGSFQDLIRITKKDENHNKSALFLDMQNLKIIKIELPPGVVGMNYSPCDGKIGKYYDIAVQEYMKYSLQQDKQKTFATINEYD